MTKLSTQEIIKEYELLGRYVAEEVLLGEQLLKLSVEQRKAHQKTLTQQDKVRNLIDDNK
jgi:hypothetical protein